MTKFRKLNTEHNSAMLIQQSTSHKDCYIATPQASPVLLVKIVKIFIISILKAMLVLNFSTFDSTVCFS